MLAMAGVAASDNNYPDATDLQQLFFALNLRDTCIVLYCITEPV
jgi:hypothetical protein